MKSFALLGALVLGMAMNVNGAEIHTTVSEVDGNTVISCMSLDNKGDVNRARIFLYVSNGVYFETGIQPMDVSYENVASYELPGTYALIEGKCKLIILEADKKVTRQEFLVSMR